jgi:glycosyltransferase involved in cell wall biosynthesis
LLATAFSEIVTTVDDVKLLLVGSGEEEGKIRAVLSKALGKGMVHIQSGLPHENLVEWYRAMDLFVMPSRYETMSNAILEAQACGVPFLASDIAGNRAIANGGGGWLFEHGSAHSLSAQVKRILEGPGEMKARGVTGAEHVRKTYNWEASAERLESIFKSCMDMKGRAQCRR